MGCDIHLYVERRDAGGAWELVGTDENYPSGDRRRTPDDAYPYYAAVKASSDRNYALFGLLSGVRRDPPPSGQLAHDEQPSDLSPATLAYFSSWGPDAHTPGWCSLPELVAALDAIRETGATGFAELVRIVAFTSPVPADVRIVFRYDN